MRASMIATSLCLVVSLPMQGFAQNENRDRPKGPVEAAGRAIRNAVGNRQDRRAEIRERLREAREQGEEYRRQLQSNFYNRMQSRDEVEASTADREQVREERRQRLENARERAQENREDARENARQTAGRRYWRDWSRESFSDYGDWYRGPWTGPSASRSGATWWDYRWNRYPVQTSLGLSPWRAYRGAYTFGLSQYRNPFYVQRGGDAVVIDYSQPLYAYAVPANAVTTDAFAQARQAFQNRDYEASLASINAAILEKPGDAVMHEFRALVLFALKQYEPAAEAIYAVLSANPPWSYETMVGLYPDEGTYATQLRMLERYRADHSNQPAARFLLGYHYLVGGKEDATARELEAYLRLVPNDPVGTELLVMTGGNIPEKASVMVNADRDFVIEDDAIVGTWSDAENNAYQLVLKENGEFVWQPKGGRAPIEGIYVTDGSQIILEADDGSVIVANVAAADQGAYWMSLDGGIRLKLRR